MIRVVVVNWNALDLTSRCLRSLEATDWPRDDLELVVVDNASIDGSLRILRERHPRCRFIANGANLGFAEACNRAMANLDGVEFVALVNNDAVVEPGWLAPLVETMRADESVGAVSPRMVFDRWFQTVELEVGGRGDRARVAGIAVDAIEVTDTVICRDGVDRPPHPSIALRLGIEVARHGTLEVPVPAAPAAPLIELTVESDRPLTVSCGGVEAERVERPGTAQVFRLEPTGAPHRLINSLGTGLTEWSEGYERRLGDLDDPDIEAETVTGWTGGGVLLRAAALEDVGRFDPTFFMYYEDTDLAWRMRRAGWITRTCPASVIRHRLGATAGSSWSGFHFLNYRNWLLTVARNGSASEMRRAAHAAWRNSWPFVRRNVVGRLRRFQRPDTDIAGRWLRVAVGTLAALPRTVGARPLRTGRLLGRSPVDSVRSVLLTTAPPAAPAVDPDGPTLVYADVTDAVDSRWRAGIQRALTELLSRLMVDHPEVSIVLIRWSHADLKYRRFDLNELDSFFHPEPMNNHPERMYYWEPPLSYKLKSIVANIPAVRRRIDEHRRAKLRKERPDYHAGLLLERFEPGSLFFDADATWNPAHRKRSELYPELREGGVRIVTLLHDVLPVTRPEWFDPDLVAVFSSHVDAALTHAEAIITSSQFSAGEIGSLAATIGRSDLAIEAVTLGSDPATSTIDLPDRELLDKLEGRQIILTVGTLEPRKNHAALLDAFERMYTEPTLVIVGRQGWWTEELTVRIRRHQHFGTRLFWPAEVNDATLAALYDMAAVVAVPSLAEGYGLPVVEALRHGCRVVSSDGGSLREVGGEAVTYVDTTDPKAFATALESVMRQSGPAPSVELPTWDATASAVAAVLARRPSGR